MRQRGFTYLWVLVAIAVLGIGLVAASEVWQPTARRQRLEQLEWAGTQYTKAIGAYVESTPGIGKNYPEHIDELLEDRRFAVPRRHLRQFYGNPVALDGHWELIMGSDLRIHGVRARLPWDPGLPAREWIYVRGAGT